MTTHTIRAEILEAHRGRRPELVALKMEKLAADPFSFFRGTAGLFYRAWAQEPLPEMPLAWLCGDAHLENVGSYKGDDGVTYFDLNDFDKCGLGSLHWEIGRAVASLYVAGLETQVTVFLERYRTVLASGKAKHVERQVATGAVRELLDQVGERKHKELLRERVKGQRLREREGKTFSLEKKERAEVQTVFKCWSKKAGMQAEVLDICGRIAGNDSLGLRRYLVLVAEDDGLRILDMKQVSLEASPVEEVRVAWSCGAERVATVQGMLQYVPTSRLAWVDAGAESFTLRGLEASEDRLELARLSRKKAQGLVENWAGLLASAHLRTAGWLGSATLEELMQFGAACERRLLAIQASARALARKNAEWFSEFAEQQREAAG